MTPYASMQVCTYIQVCKYASMKVCKYASMHTYASMQVCRYASMHSLEPDPGILIVLGSGKLLFSLVAIGLNNLKLFWILFYFSNFHSLL